MPKIIPIENIEDIRNKVTSLEGTLTDEQYPSAKAVSDALTNINTDNIDLSGKQDKFVDITNDEYEGQLIHSTLTSSAPNIDWSTGSRLIITAAEEMGLLLKSTNHAGGFYFGHYDSPFVADKYGIYHRDDTPSSSLSTGYNYSRLLSDWHGLTITSSDIGNDFLYDSDYANIIIDKKNEDIILHSDKIIVGKITSSSGSTAGTITNLAAPVNPTDAANKEYVDSNCHILTDRTTGTRYRLYIDNGEIKTEVVE